LKILGWVFEDFLGLPPQTIPGYWQGGNTEKDQKDTQKLKCQSVAHLFACLFGQKPPFCLVNTSVLPATRSRFLPRKFNQI